MDGIIGAVDPQAGAREPLYFSWSAKVLTDKYQLVYCR